MNKQIRFIVDVAIFSGLGLVLDLVAEIYSATLFPNGGSIGFAMTCIFIMAFKYNLKGGLLSGFLIGIIQTLISCKTVGFNALTVFIQIAMDYWLAYTVVGLAGIFSKKMLNSETLKEKNKFFILGISLGVLLRLTVASLAGIIFWSAYFPSQFLDKGMLGIIIYSFGYNALYLIPSGILCAIVLIALNHKFPKMFIIEEYEEFTDVK
ncbi:MAG: energy-coupled thiamine transporter ThiT [Bacilli bacterium]|jgi:thiamine transporter